MIGVVAVMLDGLNVTPLGNPAAVRAMLAEKPFVGATVTVLLPVAPATTVALLAERVKSGVAAVAALSVNCDW